MDRLFRALYRFFRLNGIRLFYLMPLVFIGFITLEWAVGGMVLGHLPQYGPDPDPTATFGELLCGVFAMTYFSLALGIIISPIVILLSVIYKRVPSVWYVLAYPAGIVALHWFPPANIGNWVFD